MALNRMLITGGCGFVGRELVRLAQEHHEVHVVDSLRSGERRVAGMDAQRFVLHRQDIREAKAVRQIMDHVRPNVIVHLAAVHFIPECEASPDLAVSINVQGTVNLLDSAPEGCAFVNVSSAAVYAPSDSALDEEASTLGPCDVYGWTKLHGEHYARYYSEKRGLPTMIVRLFNVIGPGETNPHLAPEITRQIKSGASIIELGNLTPKRDYIDVGDVADGLMRISQLIVGGSKVGCDVVNLGTGRAYSVMEVTEQLCRASGRTVEIRSEASRIRKVDRPLLLASTRKLQSLTGWTPKTTIEESAARIWADPELLGASC